MEFEKPRRSADGFRGMEIESLRRVNYFRYMDSCLDTPSTGSTQSSMFHTTSDSTIAATTAASQKEGKGPSLIAKLMGIEEYPSRPLQAALKKQFEEGEKTISSQYLGNQLLRQSQSRNAHLRNVACNSTERKRNHLKKENPAKNPKTKNVVSEESEKRIITDHKSDASPIKAGLADENPKEEETDAFVSQSEGRYGLLELQELDYVVSRIVRRLKQLCNRRVSSFERPLRLGRV
ncbi:unnamed protein product [Malus baccata var. baccata]